MDEERKSSLDAVEDDFTSAPGKRLGSYLRTERERQGLALADILERTRLQIPILEAIENEDWDRLPSAVLARAFVNNYAKSLGLDADRLLERFGNELPLKPAPLRPLEADTKRSFTNLILFFGGLLLAGLLVFLLFAGNSTTRQQEDPPAANEVQPAPPNETQSNHMADPGLNATSPAAPGTNTSAGPAGEPDPAPLPAERGTGTAAAPSLPDAVNHIETSAAGTTPTARSVTPAGRTLRAEVVERVWIRVLADGKRLEEGIYSPGTTKEWHAQEGFELHLGNAGGLRLELDGQQLEPIGKSGQVVRVTLPPDYRPTRQED